MFTVIVLVVQHTHLEVFIKESIGIHWLEVVIPLPLWEAGLGILSILSPQPPPCPPVLDQSRKTTISIMMCLTYGDYKKKTNLGLTGSRAP